MNHLDELAEEIDETIKDFPISNRREALSINKLMFQRKIRNEDHLIGLIKNGLDELSVACWQKYYKETFYRALKIKAFW